MLLFEVGFEMNCGLYLSADGLMYGVRYDSQPGIRGADDFLDSSELFRLSLDSEELWMS